MSGSSKGYAHQVFNRNTLAAPKSVIARIQSELDAIRLIDLGARATLVCQLTGVDKKIVRRLYRQLTGASSAPGLTPFTDAWYIQDNRLMLHASVVWKLYRQTTAFVHSAARQLIAVYQAYVSLVKTPLLDITRVHFATRLVTTQSWQERVFPECRTNYLAPVERLELPCYGCILYFDQRCRHCQSILHNKGRGRPLKHCQSCGLIL